MRSPGLDRIVVELIQDVLVEVRRERRLVDLVLERWEPTGSKHDKAPRKDVYAHVAARLRVILNNERCNQIRRAVLSLPGVYCTKGGSRMYFRGLRPKGTA